MLVFPESVGHLTITLRSEAGSESKYVFERLVGPIESSVPVEGTGLDSYQVRFLPNLTLGDTFLNISNKRAEGEATIEPEPVAKTQRAHAVGPAATSRAHKKVILGSTRFSAAPHQKVKILLRLNRGGRKLVLKHHWLRTRVQISLKASSGLPRVTKIATVTFLTEKSH